MTRSSHEFSETGTPSKADSRLADESGRRLARFVTAKRKAPLRVRIGPDGEPGETISIPVPAIRLLSHILSEMAKGNAVTLVPVDAELTTQQAAGVLNVSRPFVIEQMEKGAIPYRRVGTHRRVLFRDLAAYKHAIDQNRMQALEQLSALDQELGLGYGK